VLNLGYDPRQEPLVIAGAALALGGGVPVWLGPATRRCGRRNATLDGSGSHLAGLPGRQTGTTPGRYGQPMCDVDDVSDLSHSP